MSSQQSQPSIWEFNFVVRVLGGLAMIASWLLYHVPYWLGFELIPFEEIIKILILGMVLVGMSFWLEREKRMLGI